MQREEIEERIAGIRERLDGASCEDSVSKANEYFEDVLRSAVRAVAAGEPWARDVCADLVRLEDEISEAYETDWDAEG